MKTSIMKENNGGLNLNDINESLLEGVEANTVNFR
jgi:hypothetical protein